MAARKKRSNPNASRARARARARQGPKRPRTGGKESTYSEAVAARLCHWIASGRTLSDFCREQGAPGWTTVHDWLDRHPDFAAQYNRARVLGAHAIAEEVLQIADTPMLGEIETEETWGGDEGEDGSPGTSKKVVREDMLGHRKLRIEARLKLLAKWFPKHYGDKIDVEHKGKLSFDTMLRNALGLEGEDAAS